MDYESLVKFPIQDDDGWIITVLIGGVLLLLGVFIVPALIAWGYVVEVMRGGVEGVEEPPGFDDWGTLAVDGLKSQVILIVYQIPAFVVGGAMGLLSLGFLASGSDAGAGLGFLGILLTALVWGAASLVLGYFGLAGVVNFAVEGSLGAGFDIGTVRQVSFSGTWLKAWLFFIVLNIVASIVGSIAGGIGTPFTTFYALSVGGRAFGEAFATITGREAPAAEPAPATA